MHDIMILFHVFGPKTFFKSWNCTRLLHIQARTRLLCHIQQLSDQSLSFQHYSSTTVCTSLSSTNVQPPLIGHAWLHTLSGSRNLVQRHVWGGSQSESLAVCFVCAWLLLCIVYFAQICFKMQLYGSPASSNGKKIISSRGASVHVCECARAETGVLHTRNNAGLPRRQQSEEWYLSGQEETGEEW